MFHFFLVFLVKIISCVNTLNLTTQYKLDSFSTFVCVLVQFWHKIRLFFSLGIFCIFLGCTFFFFFDFNIRKMLDEREVSFLHFFRSRKNCTKIRQFLTYPLASRLLQYLLDKLVRQIQPHFLSIRFFGQRLWSVHIPNPRENLAFLKKNVYKKVWSLTVYQKPPDYFKHIL